MNKTEITPTLKGCVSIARSFTARYAENHKGRNALEKECIQKGYIIRKYGDVFPYVPESQKNKLGIFALDFNIVHRKGGFVAIR